MMSRPTGIFSFNKMRISLDFQIKIINTGRLLLPAYPVEESLSMKIEKGRISSTQLMFSIGCFIQASSLFTAFALNITLQDTWLPILAGFIISIPIFLMYAALYRKYPGQSLIEINDIVYGPYIGKAVSAFYIFFFLSVTTFNVREMGSFVVTDIMPETPMNAIIIMMVFVCAYAASKGVETFTSYSTFFIFIFSAILLFNGVLLISDMDLKEFLPALTLNYSKYVQSTHLIIVIPFCEIVSFLMFFPCVKDTKKLGKTLIAGLSIGAATVFFVVARDIAVLGPLVSILKLPSYETVRQIDVGNVLSKMEILYAFILLLLLFYKITILFYATVMSIAQSFHLRTYTPLVSLVGVVIVSYSILYSDSSIENVYWETNFVPFFYMIFELIIPMITFILALMQKRKRQKAG